jgi:hypothetical protein
MLVLVIGAIAYGLEGILFTATDPVTLMYRLAISLTGLTAWLVGSILCLLAFRHRF